MVVSPLPLEHFHDQLLAAQQVLNPTIIEPIITRLALLTLSQQVSGVDVAGNDMLVMEFFGIFWVYGRIGSVGFFATESDATLYLMEMVTEPE